MVGNNWSWRWLSSFCPVIGGGIDNETRWPVRDLVVGGPDDGVDVKFWASLHLCFFLYSSDNSVQV